MKASQSDYYHWYMNSDEWRIKRLERLALDKFRCVACGRSRALEVHHVTYKRLGHEDVRKDLCTLCRPCHEKIHNYYDRIR